MDVDARTFYPYTPNEVKHRKRTSRAQLTVLEDHFRRDTKPNGALRKILADQLDMSVRGVQVFLFIFFLFFFASFFRYRSGFRTDEQRKKL